MSRQTKPLLARVPERQGGRKSRRAIRGTGASARFQFHVGQVDGRDAGKPVVLVPPGQRSAFRLQFLLGDGDQTVQGRWSGMFHWRKR